MKDSTASEGKCLHFWAHIFQFDQNTGPCNFLGRYGDKPHAVSYDFGDAIVSVEGIKGDGFALPSGVVVPGDTCGKLDPIVSGDLVEIWGINVTTTSYDTVNGGSNTYTRFALVDIKKYGSS